MKSFFLSVQYACTLGENSAEIRPQFFQLPSLDKKGWQEVTGWSEKGTTPALASKLFPLLKTGGESIEKGFKFNIIFIKFADYKRFNPRGFKMISIFMLLLVVVAILLMGIVLIQSSKGGGLAGTFGGGDASTVFGVRRTADFLVKLTSILATVLLLFSLVTNVIINKGGGTSESIIQQNPGQNFPEPNVPNQMQQPTDQQQQNQQPTDGQQQNTQQPGDQQQNTQPPK